MLYLLQDYLDHLLNCTINYFDLTCFGSSGIPQKPEVVFGGFKGENYTSAGAAVITILVTNDADLTSPHIKRCLDWEEAFISTVRQWKALHASEVVVSFTAEVSTSLDNLFFLVLTAF